MNRLIFALAYAEALRVPPPDRGIQLEHLAAALDLGAASSFADQAEPGIGLCQVRPQVLGMYVNHEGATDPFIARQEFPHDESARRTIRNQLKSALEQLSAGDQADLFNMLRFPKSNLRVAITLMEALMSQYFSGETLPEILADETKAKTLIAQFKEGPFALA